MRIILDWGMQENPIDPVRRKLDCIPLRALVEELVDLLIHEMKWVGKNPHAARGYRPSEVRERLVYA